MTRVFCFLYDSLWSQECHNFSHVIFAAFLVCTFIFFWYILSHIIIPTKPRIQNRAKYTSTIVRQHTLSLYIQNNHYTMVSQERSTATCSPNTASPAIKRRAMMISPRSSAKHPFPTLPLLRKRSASDLYSEERFRLKMRKCSNNEDDMEAMEGIFLPTLQSCSVNDEVVRDAHHQVPSFRLAPRRSSRWTTPS